MSGLWRTDAPITPEHFDRLRGTLNSLTTALDSVVAYGEHDVILDALTVYIDGVKFEWEDQRTVRDFGR